MLAPLSSCLSLILVAVGPAAAIWPAPQSFTNGTSVLYLHQNIKVTYNNESVCWPSCCSIHAFPEHGPRTEQYVYPQIQYTYGYEPRTLTSKEVVQAGVSRALTGILNSKFVPWMLHKPGSDFEPDLGKGQKWVNTLQISQTSKDEPSAFKPLAGEVDESYNLTMSAEGDVRLSAVSSIGVLRGLETFTQLFYQHSKGNFWYTPYAPVSIQDAPRFPHRGVMMDTARHFFPVSDILRTIEAMAWNKLNRLHIHATDSQSWPLVLPSMPEVSEKGAYHSSQTYSPADIEKIQQYGAQRGVEVYFEIDMPGHIGSVSLSHPELIVAYNVQPYYWYCAQPPCGAFKLNDTAVDAFLEKLFDDVLPRVAPYAAYFHTGGDELNKNDSMLDEGIRSNDSAVLQPLLQKFIDTQHARVRKAGLTPITWEEIPLDWNVTMEKDTVVQSWLGGGAVKKLAGMGYKVIDSDYNFWVSNSQLTHSPLFLSLPSLSERARENDRPPEKKLPLLTRNKQKVPRLRPRPMAQLGQRRRLPDGLPLRRLVRADQELAAHVLARPRGRPDSRGSQAGAGRRGGRVERDHRLGQLRLARLAARQRRRRGALVGEAGRRRAVPQPDGRRAAPQRVQGEDGAQGRGRLAVPADVLHAGRAVGVRIPCVSGLEELGYLGFRFFLPSSFRYRDGGLN
jgi:hexosaminidase